MAFTQMRFRRFLKTASDADTAFSINTAEYITTENSPSVCLSVCLCVLTTVAPIITTAHRDL